jgi:dUTP pyrophosphatase
MLSVKIELLSHGVLLPEYQTSGASGADLYAANDTDITLLPMKRVLIPTGIKILLPENYEAQIRPRSGLALKNGITLLNSPGTIDSDYRGEIQVILVNLSEEAFVIQRSMRIAQMVIMPVIQVQFNKVDLIDASTKRGESGFGSTGVNPEPRIRGL